MLPSGLSLTVSAEEIRRQGCQTNRIFADCLALGADFPTLRFTLTEMKTFKPTWADSWNEGGKDVPRIPRHKMPPWTDYENDAPANPPAQTAKQVLLPLEPKNVPPFPRGGGSHGYGGR
jgi:hypothetical protein